MTNYENIKNMSVEELAEFLCGLQDCSKCKHYTDCYMSESGFLRWLRDKQEVTNDN